MSKKKKKKWPKVLKPGKHQIGNSVLSKDKRYKGMLPGKRISKDGNVYYEYRKNRTDMKGKKV